MKIITDDELLVVGKRLKRKIEEAYISDICTLVDEIEMISKGIHTIITIQTYLDRPKPMTGAEISKMMCDYADRCNDVRDHLNIKGPM